MGYFLGWGMEYNKRLQELGIGDSDNENEFSDDNDPLLMNQVRHETIFQTLMPMMDGMGISAIKKEVYLICFSHVKIQALQGFSSHIEIMLTFSPFLHEADRYAQEQKDDHPDENMSPWNTPTIEEMRAFLGLCFLMSINVKPDLKSYWSTDVMMETPYFAKTMTRDRF